jgi:hypothetical protein
VGYFRESCESDRWKNNANNFRAINSVIFFFATPHMTVAFINRNCSAAKKFFSIQIVAAFNVKKRRNNCTSIEITPAEKKLNEIAIVMVRN